MTPGKTDLHRADFRRADFRRADFRRAEIASVLAIAVLAGCFPALQPILLGTLQAAGKIDAGLIGTIASVEALSMALSATLAAAVLPPRRLRLQIGLALAAIVLTNGLTAVSGIAGIFAARAISGLASGVILWILVGLMTRAANPGRVFAIYVTCQGLVAFALSIVLTQMVVPALGAAGGYGLLAGCALLLLAVCAFVPRAYAATAAHATGSLPNLAGALGLAGIFCSLAGLFAFWVYFPTIAAAHGHDAGVIGRAISVGMAGQILGGLAAITLAGRMSATSAVVGSVIALGAIVAAVTWLAGDTLLYPALFAFNVLWMFAPPFQLPLVMQSDRSNQSAMYVSPAQLFGVASGPSIAAAGIGFGATGPALIAIALFAAALVLFLLGRALTGNAMTNDMAARAGEDG